MPAFFESMNNILIPRIGKLTVKELVFIYFTIFVFNAFA